MIAPVWWRISAPVPAPAAASSAEPMTAPPAYRAMAGSESASG
jgi:hypothetical protein